MEEVSYWVNATALATVIACWIVFASAFILRAKPPQTRDAVRAPTSWLGIVLQGLAYVPVWSVQRRPFLSPFVDHMYVLNVALQIAAAAIAIASVYLTFASLRELGKQWSLQARLVEGHDLVTTGPYNLVRHPIYTSMLGKLIATGLVLSHWAALVTALLIFLAGTFIRTRFEERLLNNALGETFQKWKARVPGLIPFVK